MPSKVKFMKTKWYPRPHDMRHSWYHGLESAVVNQFTIYPLVMYDEGLGAPSAYEAHPENSAFVQSNAANCFPESTIDFVVSEVRFAMAKGLYGTDNVNAVRGCFMPIMCSFEDYEAVDELSSKTVKDVLELQTEATDNQGFPLYNTVKMIEKFANSALMATEQPGLT